MRYAWSVICAGMLLWVGCGSDTGVSTDTQAPEAPRNLRAERFSDGEAVLTWEFDEEAEVRGFRVYRADGRGVPFAEVGFVEEKRFRDIGLDYETVYSYRVVAVSERGAESAPVEISGRPLNALWPARPRSLSAEAFNFQTLGYEPAIELFWDPGEEADLDCYVIYGSTDPHFTMDESTKLGRTTETRFAQYWVVPGDTYFFKVTAVDRGGLESGAAEVGVGLIEPVVLKLPVNGGFGEGKPAFEWGAVPVGVQGARVVYTVSVSTGPASREIWVGELEGGDGRLRFDGDRLVGGTYWWKVLVEVVYPGGARSSALSPLQYFRVR